MRFFKPRYSLATVLIAVTATALLLWGVPEWRELKRRMEFERAVRQLSVGLEPNLFNKLPPHSHDGHLTGAVFSDVEGNHVRTTPIFYKRYWYCIYAHQKSLTAQELSHEQQKERDEIEKLFNASVAQGLKPAEARKKVFESSLAKRPIGGRNGQRWAQVRVYRLIPMPRGYRAQSKRGKQKITRHPEMIEVDREPQDQYLTDFYEMIAGRETRDLGIKYELIHADPPVPAK